MKHHVFKKVLLVSSVMLLSITGSAFAEDAVITNKGERLPLDANVRLSVSLKDSVTPVILQSELTLVSEEIGVYNQQKNVTVSRDFAPNETIPSSIIYTEDNGSQGRWGGTLSRTNDPAPVALPGGGLRVYYKGTVYKDVD
ncbi:MULTISPECIES: hypothetical protein [Paenibacillus]|uniref:WxL domain-containing protein n=1 Tax=Paenibacillus vini TaxID=1476024 RepID=A0ABQ4ME76_9BACL|nr:hypothetical protein [Paenibacillus vini]MDN4069714.1 hypothetical protein [Paenibacillus vini]GIP54281.1 hypothetical protein J42TS3_33160 [Paenibacillus vini]